MPFHLIYTGSDYIVNPQNPLSRIFTVTFQPKQANSTEHPIILSDDVIFERPESFRLRILDARFIGEAATFFRAQEGLTNTTATVNIRDNDCEFRMSAFIYSCIPFCFQIITKRTYNYVVQCTCLMHELFPSPVIEVNWTISEPIEREEGDGVLVRLRGEAFGIYANPVQIGVVCKPTQVTGVPAGRETIPGSDTSIMYILLHN